MYASKEGHKDAIEALIALGADIHAKDKVRCSECDALRGVEIIGSFCSSVKVSIHLFAHPMPAWLDRITLGC